VNLQPQDKKNQVKQLHYNMKRKKNIYLVWLFICADIHAVSRCCEFVEMALALA